MRWGDGGNIVASKQEVGRYENHHIAGRKDPMKICYIALLDFGSSCNNRPGVGVQLISMISASLYLSIKGLVVLKTIADKEVRFLLR